MPLHYIISSTYGKRDCPKCEHSNRLSPGVYMHGAKPKLMDEKLGYGICDRDSSCGYVKKTSTANLEKDGLIAAPKVGASDSTPTKTLIPDSNEVLVPAPTYHHPMQVDSFWQSKNNLFLTYYPHGSTQEKVNLFNYYKITLYENNAVIYWQIDEAKRVHAGKILNYELVNGELHRTFTNWAHTKLKLRNFTLKQYWFGGHLLNINKQPIAIFEAEKTCLILAPFMPNFVCIASGGKDNYLLTNPENWKSFKERDVVLYPDLGCYEDWQEVAQLMIESGVKAIVSNYMELHHNGVDNGSDLADIQLPENFEMLERLRVLGGQKVIDRMELLYLKFEKPASPVKEAIEQAEKRFSELPILNIINTSCNHSEYYVFKEKGKLLQICLDCRGLIRELPLDMYQVKGENSKYKGLYLIEINDVGFLKWLLKNRDDINPLHIEWKLAELRKHKGFLYPSQHHPPLDAMNIFESRIQFLQKEGKVKFFGHLPRGKNVKVKYPTYLKKFHTWKSIYGEVPKKN